MEINIFDSKAPNIYQQYIDYQDTDAGNIVYHGSYINFAERARAKLFREVFKNFKYNYLWVVVEVHAKFKSPAKLNDFITVQTTVNNIKSCYINFEHNFFVKQKLLVTIFVKLVSLSPCFKIVRFSNDIKVELDKYKIKNNY